MMTTIQILRQLGFESYPVKAPKGTRQAREYEQRIDDMYAYIKEKERTKSELRDKFGTSNIAMRDRLLKTGRIHSKPFYNKQNGMTTELYFVKENGWIKH